MTEDQVRDLVRQKATRFADRRNSSGVTGWGRAKGVNKGHLSEFMNGLRGPDTDLLAALGLEWRIVRRRPAALSTKKGAGL